MLRPLTDFFERYRLRPESPDLLTLQAVATAFSYLPYENVTKILKDARNNQAAGKLRDVGEVLEDHLQWGTGGTCFSLCNALSKILAECGFSSHISMADMHYGRNIHCAVIVNLQKQKYLLDPGYLLHDPIPLPGMQLEAIRQTPMNVVSIRSEAPDTYSLYTSENNQVKWRYRLHAVPVPAEEFHEHWLHSFSLNTMEHVMLSRIGKEGRIYYRKNRIETVNHASRQNQKASSGESDLLASVFGIPADLIDLAQKTLRGADILSAPR